MRFCCARRKCEPFLLPVDFSDMLEAALQINLKSRAAASDSLPRGRRVVVFPAGAAFHGTRPSGRIGQRWMRPGSPLTAQLIHRAKATVARSISWWSETAACSRSPAISASRAPVADLPRGEVPDRHFVAGGGSARRSPTRKSHVSSDQAGHGRHLLARTYALAHQAPASTRRAPARNCRASG